MKMIFHQYRNCFSKEFIYPMISAIVFLVLSIITNFYAGEYATARQSNFVTDIVLSNIPVFHLEFIFVQGAIFFILGLIIFCFLRPKLLPFTFKSLALLTIIRAVFISLTHLGQFPTHMQIDPLSVINKFSFGGDLFFSGHTGVPFLMAIIFWPNKKLRNFFIAVSIVFGASALLAHMHYSIDVLGAFFITFTIAHLAKKFFAKDYKLFLSDDFLFRKK